MRSRASRDAFPSGTWERHRFNGGAVAVCFEGCCGGMCWPVDRPATHAAAGAAARGVRGIGGLFHTPGAWERHRIRIRCAGRPQEWSCGAVPPREWMARGRLVFVFSWGLLRCRRGILSRAQERSATHAAAGAAARGVLVFLWCVSFPLSGHMLREHVLAGGPASHACRRGSGSTRGFNFLAWGI